MSDVELDDEGRDVLTELERLTEKIPKGMFVSGWDDDDDVEVDPNPTETPEKEFLWAATENKIDVVQILLSKYPHLINISDADGYSALHKACYNNNYDMALLLLKYKCDVNARTEMQWTPLHSACKWNNAKMVALLLQYGADINALSEGDQTPLHIATTVSSCRDTLVELFMDNNLQPDLTNNSNETAAQIARRTGLSYAFFDMVKEGMNPKMGMLD